jgi:hypothetical protein
MRSEIGVRLSSVHIFFILFRFVLLVNMFAQLNDPQSHTHDPTKPTYTHSYTPTTSNHPGINFCATNYCQKLGNKAREEKEEKEEKEEEKKTLAHIGHWVAPTEVNHQFSFRLCEENIVSKKMAHGRHFEETG